MKSTQYELPTFHQTFQMLCFKIQITEKMKSLFASEYD